ncbi:EPIDERMAL PATTERNING FACTOR-like protein 2 [Musa acuminata AAA Group]|uniref:EPIDERMAL PATTERNING FACTOR-like protein 2 n=1 Tax=Musa acuminata AAA Group TaxID=214697 RepID=UPI0031D400E8
MGPLDRIGTKSPLCLLLLMLFLLSYNPIKHSVEGRSLLTLLEVASGRGEEKATVRALVGSRPPICERRCITCGHCEAVQVPVIPQEKKSRSRQFLGTATVRGDYSSNYKPLSWKCKCGDLIFDP